MINYLKIDILNIHWNL